MRSLLSDCLHAVLLPFVGLVPNEEHVSLFLHVLQREGNPPFDQARFQADVVNEDNSIHFLKFLFGPGWTLVGLPILKIH